MSEDIGPGDKVICVDDGKSGWHAGEWSDIHVGSIYTVTRVFRAGEPLTLNGEVIVLQEDAIWLVETDTHTWALSYFRKAGRGGMFDKLLVVDPETTKSPISA